MCGVRLISDGWKSSLLLHLPAGKNRSSWLVDIPFWNIIWYTIAILLSLGGKCGVISLIPPFFGGILKLNSHWIFCSHSFLHLLDIIQFLQVLAFQLLYFSLFVADLSLFDGEYVSDVGYFLLPYVIVSQFLLAISVSQTHAVLHLNKLFINFLQLFTILYLHLSGLRLDLLLLLFLLVYPGSYPRVVQLWLAQLLFTRSK